MLLALCYLRFALRYLPLCALRFVICASCFALRASCFVLDRRECAISAEGIEVLALLLLSRFFALQQHPPSNPLPCKKQPGCFLHRHFGESPQSVARGCRGVDSSFGETPQNYSAPPSFLSHRCTSTEDFVHHLVLRRKKHLIVPCMRLAA